MGTFQLVLGIGLAAIVGLAIAGVYPVAFAAALVLVPLMMVLYMWDVDVYEDEPLRVIGYTAGWGVVTGVDRRAPDPRVRARSTSARSARSRPRPSSCAASSSRCSAAR